ncbi:hypothetical protein [Acinetobacter bereziniae]|uniref:hypothetical protein n=1 Tax=Acinetobacter bereziniae TaxID=106648 RepID=UPI003008C670
MSASALIFFDIVESYVHLTFKINNIKLLGELEICPDQINDLASQVNSEPVDIDKLRKAIESLIYLAFKGERTVNSPIWNNEEVKV